ncbi:hypothetical protein [Kribbella monticola]|uniref:hypothetical protein n=1 Tax=Kribbella monticola TaxID=2185285 RepID=UPI000DD2E374|nr:hypothetical protein [Kribbella monticola]
MSNDAAVPIEAVQVGAGRFLLAAEAIAAGALFAVGDQTFRVVSEPVPVGGATYLANITATQGPRAGRLITAALQVGRQVRGPG